jgi:hypothetical protein
MGTGKESASMTLPSSRNFRKAAVFVLSAPVLLAPAAAFGVSAAPEPSRGADAGYQAPVLGRYLPIIERKPFGVAPPPAPILATNLLVNPAGDPARNYILFGIVRTPAGDIAVGFTDNGAKPPRSLLLAIGEESDGYKVLAADIEEETATLLKDGTKIDLRMSGAGRAPTPAVPPPIGPPSGVPPAFSGVRPPLKGGDVATMSMADYASRMAGRKSPDAPPAAATVESRALNSVGVIDRLISSGSTDSSYVSRLRERREQLLKQAEEDRKSREQDVAVKAQASTKEELDRRLREANLGLIRKGLKPIGTIELTPEEDAKLVAEGVLPAR